jgi:4-carboxymuconolactone decarboxylase
MRVRSKALVSVAIAASLGTHEPLRGQLRIAQNNADSKTASSSCSSISRPTRAARAFDSYQIALAVFESDLA